MTSLRAPGADPEELILVATDGGDGSRAALRWVAERVGAGPAHVRVIAVEEDRASDAATALRAAARALATLSPGSTIESSLQDGDPSEAIVDAASAATLVVVGSRTDGGPLTAPRVPVRVAAHAPCPVVIVPDDWSPRSGAIVVGSSHDSAADAAVEVAAGIAAAQRAELVIAHAWDLPAVGAIPPVPSPTESIPERQRDALEQIAAEVRSQHPGIHVSTALEQGGAAESLSRVARGASLLVVGRRARGNIARVLLGSVSHDVVRHPPCPVMVIPAPEPGIRVAPDLVPEDL
jgi:nucleotide-binding universal stress UspA family protein